MIYSLSFIAVFSAFFIHSFSACSIKMKSRAVLLQMERTKWGKRKKEAEKRKKKQHWRRTTIEWTRQILPEKSFEENYSSGVMKIGNLLLDFIIFFFFSGFVCILFSSCSFFFFFFIFTLPRVIRVHCLLITWGSQKLWKKGLEMCYYRLLLIKKNNHMKAITLWTETQI